MVLIRCIYGVVYSTIIIGMLRYIIIIIYEVPTKLLWKSAEVSPWAPYRQLPKITHFGENYVIDDAASMRTLTSGHFY